MVNFRPRRFWLQIMIKKIFRRSKDRLELITHTLEPTKDTLEPMEYTLEPMEEMSEPTTHTLEPAALPDSNVQSKPILFVHIPKTAGTSFRAALEQIQKIEKDYGAKSKDTTPLIETHIYQAADNFALSTHHVSDAFSLSGHFALQKYSDLYDVRHIVTFVREPIAQVVSHFNHAVNLHGFTGSFADFYQRAPLINIQSKNLSALPLSLIGHVGVTERYDESLSLINHDLELGLEVLQQNKRIKAHKDTMSLEGSESEQLSQLYSNDIDLYQQALELHDQRMGLFNEQLSWSHIHAQVNPHNVLHGCAYFADSDDMVELIVKVNGEVVGECKTGDFYGGFAKFRLPRARYIGFRFPMATYIESGIQRLELVVKDTGQIYKVALPKQYQA